MQIESLTLYLPAFKELTTTVLVAAFFWSVKLIGSPLIHRLGRLLQSSRYNELKRAKKIRVDPFAIQRQITKEGALFCAFLVVTAISIGMIFLSLRNSLPLSSRIMYFMMYMAPVLAIEIWWLWHREFVNTLLEESGRIGPKFTRYSPARTQPAARLAERESRRARSVRKAKAKAKASKKRVGRRLI